MAQCAPRDPAGHRKTPESSGIAAGRRTAAWSRMASGTPARPGI